MVVQKAKGGEMVKKTVRFGEQAAVPAIGLGTWYMGENSGAASAGSGCTARGHRPWTDGDRYGGNVCRRRGGEVVGQAIRGLRDRVVLVSKVYPWHAGGTAMRRACENSLRRLQTDYLDMYLLHWRGDIPLQETVEAMERLVAEGKIRRWGVSNLDTDDMQALWRTAGGERCATNQVLYHLASRGIEYDLLPWCQQHTLPVMAYCPLAQAGRLRDGLFQHTDIINMANARG
jgi:diketogulonate reductase-like aldo/keto reductase